MICLIIYTFLIFPLKTIQQFNFMQIINAFYLLKVFFIAHLIPHQRAITKINPNIRDKTQLNSHL